MSVFTKVLHIGEGKRLKELQGLVTRVNALEAAVEALTDAELAAKTVEFRDRIADGETLDDLEPRRSPWCAKPPVAPSASATSTSR